MLDDWQIKNLREDLSSLLITTDQHGKAMEIFDRLVSEGIEPRDGAIAKHDRDVEDLEDTIEKYETRFERIKGIASGDDD